jgi:hypothetical protein
MLLALLALKDLFPVQHTGNKSLGAGKDNNILEISHWEQAK